MFSVNVNINQLPFSCCLFDRDHRLHLKRALLPPESTQDHDDKRKLILNTMSCTVKHVQTAKMHVYSMNYIR